jgi:serine/threonine protein phosphatase 1
MTKYFAIGDVHGEMDKLAVLLDAIVDRIEPDDEIVFLGDYVDRGPDSRKVINRVMSLQTGAEFGYLCTALRGNHEQMMVMALHEPTSYERWWLDNGGHETVESYLRHDGKNAWTESVPRAHWDWLETLPLYKATPEFIFVHAGFDPRYEWSHPRQTIPEDEPPCVWIRSPFTDMDHDFGPRIVHGHTPGKLFHGKNRTRLDTGAVFNGHLTCGIFVSGQRDDPTEFISVDPYLDVTVKTLTPA